MTAMTPTRFELRTTPTRTPCLTGGRYTRHKTPSQRSTPGDRFIPSRASTDLQFARFKMSNRLTDENSPPDKQMLDQLLGLQGLSSSSKTLGFSSTPQQGRQQKQCKLQPLNESYIHWLFHCLQIGSSTHPSVECPPRNPDLASYPRALIVFWMPPTYSMTSVSGETIMCACISLPPPLPPYRLECT